MKSSGRNPCLDSEVHHIVPMSGDCRVGELGVQEGSALAFGSGESVADLDPGLAVSLLVGRADMDSGGAWDQQAFLELVDLVVGNDGVESLDNGLLGVRGV